METTLSQSARQEALRTVFDRCGLRLTRQREAVYSALCASDTHPTAEEIHRRVLDEGTISLATVYNTLQVLCEAGVCRKLATTDGSCRYDGGSHDHAHLCVVDTGELLDLPLDISDELLEGLSPHLLRRAADEMGVEIEQISVVLTGRRISN